MRILLFGLAGLLSALQAGAQSNFYVRFPDDRLFYSPDSVATNAPEIVVVSGAQPIVSYEDFLYTVIPDACHKVERVWTIRSASADPDAPCTDIINPQPNYPALDPGNFPGPVVSPSGTPAPWAPTVTFHLPGAIDALDYSIYWSDSIICYTYPQYISYWDLKKPVILNCYQYCPIVFDESPNDPLLWNAPTWSNPSTGSHDLAEAPMQWQIMATDSFYGSDLNFQFRLFLDIDQDGTMETAVTSLDPPAPGQVNLGNVFNPNFTGGTPVDFDLRPIPADEKYRFAIRKTIAGDTVTATLMWNTLSTPDAWTTPQFPPGEHRMKWIVKDGCGNEETCEHLFGISPNTFASQETLQGTTVIDADADCQADTGEALLPGWRARLESTGNGGAPFYTQYSTPYLDGKYRFWVDTGSYLLSVEPPNGYWEICQDGIPVQVDSTGGVNVNDFAAQSFVACPFLETDIGIWGLRRCFNNTYAVRYCNTGTATAENAFLRLTLDPFMSFVDSEVFPGIDEGNNVWRFDLGNIAPGDCGSFPVTIYLDCDSTVLGQTHCIEAHIYPDTFCLDAPGWSGANIEVEGACQQDSVRFVISNTGVAPSAVLDYIVIEDNIINFSSPFQLPDGDSLEVAVPANGSTWRLEAQQEPGNPLHPAPSATVEACGLNGSGGFSFGYVSQFGEDDRDPFVSIDCQQSRSSFDPNDKQGFPLGYGDEHLIAPGQPLEYLIRFQNTGNDTAFQIVIRDTLPAWLDPATAVLGVSSHDCRFELSGAGVLNFTFDNILLPDSTVNEAASHGFVKFHVEQRPGIPLGTVISNHAAIFFDFNEPVLTNSSWHTVEENFVYVHTTAPSAGEQPAAVTVSPNPAGMGDVLRLRGVELPSAQFELFDGLGRTVLRRPVVENEVSLGSAPLPPGIYGFRVTAGGGWFGMGRLVWR